MASQTLIFILLPNGLTARKTLSLSIYLSPRLDKGATLAAFPDILNWPESIQQSGLQFEIACGTRTAKVAVDRTVLRPDIWKQIFTSTTYVEAFKVPPYDKRLVVSYPVRDALAYLKYTYQAAGTGNFVYDREGLEGLLQVINFRERGLSTLDQAISEMRVEMWREQHDQTLAGGGIAVATAAAAAPALPPDGVPTSVTPPANTRDAITRFALFHNMPPAPNRPPLPKTEADFAKTLDFHRALTALNSYPSLLRALGLVFDVEVPVSLCPASPQAGAYGTIEVKSLVPGFKWKLAPKFNFPSTAYWRDAGSFRAAPATAPASVASKNYIPGDMIGGFLALPPQDFHLAQVDLDGALLKALALADNFAVANDPTVVGNSLPALRSTGLALMADDRGFQLVESIRDNVAFDQALTAGQALPRPFNVRDLTRGFRFDIWSSRTQQWNSLHRRNAVYRFGPHLALVDNVADEEGFLQPAAAQPANDPTRQPDPVATANNIPQPGTDLYFHERIGKWEGWSLSASRPGVALNRSPDPQYATTADPTMNQPLTPFKMVTSFKAFPGSLPELRFGLRYRLRARAVDLAGNSVPLNSRTPAQCAMPANGVPLRYMRFDPVPPPVVVLRQPAQAGGSLERLVIRSYNHDLALDTTPTTETDERHIGPPRTSVRMAEQHGMFDDAQGRLRGDASTYDMIVTRDAYEFPKQGGMPLESSATLDVAYLPDPIARGAAFRDLPNAPDDTSGRLSNNALRYSTLPDVQPRPGSVTYIDFGSSWPGRSAFRLVLVEGAARPQWDATQRVLTVSLPKSGSTQVDLSSHLSPADLSIMGVWGWLREFFDAEETAAMASGVADALLSNTSDAIALLTRLVLEGGHDMITPARTLTLVHAVQQPLGRPTFVQLPVIHHIHQPILASALRNSFTPITAWRQKGSHYAVLLGALAIHGESSAKIDLQARWIEFTDDLTKPGPTQAENNAHVETIQLKTLDPGPIYADSTDTRAVAVYIPKVDTLWFSAPFDDLEGVTAPPQVAAPLHRFDDTKHRWVEYQGIATSRFEEYFTGAGLDFTRRGEPLVVDVPSSARPDTPDVAYVVPTFGWERQESSNVKSNIRFGNSIRVYLNRPWYSSGDSELLGVLLWPAGALPPDYPTRETYKPFLTQWGNDPIWQSGTINPIPSTSDFPKAVATAPLQILEETSQRFDVAGHRVAYDKERGLWYCDIEFSTSLVYTPFVRLALARYQPHSIHGVELSRVVLSDFVQLAPNRSAVISIDPVDPRKARVFVGGLGPEGPVQSLPRVTVERRKPNVLSDLGWEAAPLTEVKVTEDNPAPAEADAVLWSGTIAFVKRPPPGEFRVVIREYERLPVDAGLLDSELGQRLVYAAIIPYDYPAQ